jgi:hypothetical protein
MMRFHMTRESVVNDIRAMLLGELASYKRGDGLGPKVIEQILHDVALPHTFTPITTIVLGARDSFELNHVYGLLTAAKIPPFRFQDENEEAYGKGLVYTALATMPVTPEQVVGILDYLPLLHRTDAVNSCS